MSLSCLCPPLHSFGFFLPVPWISSSCSVVAFNWNDVGLQLIPSMLTYLSAYRSYGFLKWLCDVFGWLSWLVLHSQVVMVFGQPLDLTDEWRKGSPGQCGLCHSHIQGCLGSHIAENACVTPSNWVIPSWLILLLQGQSNVGSSLSLPGNIHPGICMWEAIVICSA